MEGSHFLNLPSTHLIKQKFIWSRCVKNRKLKKFQGRNILFINKLHIIYDFPLIASNFVNSAWHFSWGEETVWLCINLRARDVDDDEQRSRMHAPDDFFLYICLYWAHFTRVIIYSIKKEHLFYELKVIFLYLIRRRTKN